MEIHAISSHTIFYNFRLYELRANGITTFHGGHIYQNMKNSRATKPNTPKQLLDIDWKYLTDNSNDALTGTEQMLKHCIDLNQLPKKRKSTPLNIIGLTQPSHTFVFSAIQCHFFANELNIITNFPISVSFCQALQIMTNSKRMNKISAAPSELCRMRI